MCDSVTTRDRHALFKSARRFEGSFTEVHDSFEKMCRLARTDHVVSECPELPRIHALADGELAGLEAACAREHLRGCAQCRAELAFLMQLAIAVARGVVAPGSIGRPS